MERERSYGLSQIHLPAHPTITKEQALNPIFSLDWMTDQFAAGNENMWSCTRLLAKK